MAWLPAGDTPPWVLLLSHAGCAVAGGAAVYLALSLHQPIGSSRSSPLNSSIQSTISRGSETGGHSAAVGEPWPLRETVLSAVNW